MQPREELFDPCGVGLRLFETSAADEPASASTAGRVRDSA
jgi:hypothetical protein